MPWIDGHQCRLVSRRGHVFTKWDVLCEEIAHSVKAMRAVLDGEIACFEPDGRSHFYRLLFRRGDWPYFCAFDLLEVDGENLRDRPLLERKRRLKALIPRFASRLRYVDHVKERGTALFKAACQKDLEGIVAKWVRGRYETDGVSTSWLKIKNSQYSQWEGRRELFEERRDRRQRSRPSWRAPVLRLYMPSSATVSDRG